MEERLCAHRGSNTWLKPWDFDDGFAVRALGRLDRSFISQAAVAGGSASTEYSACASFEARSFLAMS